MKYRLTPFNILSFGLVIIAIYSAFDSGPMGWGFLITIYGGVTAVVVFGLDFYMQAILADRYIRLTIVQTILTLLIVGLYSWTQKSKTLIIPDKLQTHYIVTIYDVEGAPPLPTYFWKWNYEIRIPETGILLTSTSFDKDFTQTTMRTYSGIDLNSDSVDLGFVHLMDNEIKCEDQIYKYRSWMVDSGFCCVYSTREIDSLQMRLEKYYCDKKHSM